MNHDTTITPESPADHPSTRALSLTDLFAGFPVRFDSPDLAIQSVVLMANGRSMIPTIVRSDRIHLRIGPGLTAERGKIILGETSDGTYVIHRVIATSPRIVTCGDALRIPEENVVRVLGIVTRIEKTWRSRLRRVSLWLRGAMVGSFKRSFY